MYVLDTDVVSASDPVKRAYGAEAERRLKLRSSDLFLTTITVAEVRAGILGLEKRGATARSAELAAWWARLLDLYEGRVLAFDLAAAEAAAKLATASGEKVGWSDLQIAAIAASRGYTVLTRNLKDFRRIGAPCVDPFAPTDE